MRYFYELKEVFDDIHLKFRKPLTTQCREDIQTFMRQTTYTVENILDNLYEFLILHVAEEKNENDEDYVDESTYP